MFLRVVLCCSWLALATTLAAQTPSAQRSRIPPRACMGGYVQLPNGRDVDGVNLFEEGETAFMSGQYAAAYQKLSPFLARGCPEVWYFVGWMQLTGQGAPKNAAQGFDLVLKAARGGWEPAEYSVAELYLAGRGTAPDLGEAVSWYRAAAEDGNWDAYVAIGDLYRYGAGIPVNLDRAKQWYLAAADLGSLEARERYHQVATAAEWRARVEQERGREIQRAERAQQELEGLGRAAAEAVVTVRKWQCAEPPYCGDKKEAYLRDLENRQRQ